MVTEDEIDEFIRRYLEGLHEFIRETGFEIDRIETSGKMPNEINRYPSEDDIERLKTYSMSTLADGCKECSFPDVTFQAAISIESECKLFFLIIECPHCNIEYKDVMAVDELDGD